MKKLVTATVLMLLSVKLFAQIITPVRPVTPVPLSPPLPLREVSGIVKDEKGQGVVGASVTLKSISDTIKVSTNEDGIFIIGNVKQAIFNITVESLGFNIFIKKYLNSDTRKNIVLDPVILLIEATELKEVTINTTPSIIYKPDTVEYRASDYKVRENATLDELLKKMEGMEVDKDGKLTYQGQEVKKAKLNGKDYAGGDVKQAIQNLPADIIEKAQIIDDFGDQAARTGIKDRDAEKVLNVTTKADRSVGTTGRMTAQGGNNDRYNGQLFVQRINANRQLGVIGNLKSSINGDSPGGAQGGSTGSSNTGGSGTSRTGVSAFNYRDQWGKKVQAVGSYTYNFLNNNSIYNSYGQNYSSFGTSNFISQSDNRNHANTHSAHFEVDMNLDSADYLQLQPVFGYNKSPSANSSLADNVNNYTTGFEHPVRNTKSSSLNSNTNFGLTAFYLHLFKKPKRNLSFQALINRSDGDQNGNNNSDFHYYKDSTQNVLLKDSLANLLTFRTNTATTYQGTFTYTEPLNKLTQLEFKADMRHTVNDLRSTQDTVLTSGQVQELSRLNNIYNYSVTDSRVMLDYHFNGERVNLSLGAAAVPYTLRGTKIDNTSGLGATSSHSDFRIIPAFRFAYTWSSTERFSLNYTGRNTEPSFQQIQPVADRSNPDNIVVGNPGLKPAFINSLIAQYNVYLANSKFNFTFSLTGSTIDNSIASNTLLLPVPLTVNLTDPSKNTFKNITETHYVNLNGAGSVIGSYSIGKALNNRKYNLSLNGNIRYTNSPAMSNGSLYYQTGWNIDQRFNPRISPSDNFELNPYIGYNLVTSHTTLLHANPTSVKTISLGLESSMYFLKTWRIRYSASQKFIGGITGSNTNPLVLNTGIQKQFLTKKNLVFTFDAYDLLHQNNYIQQTVTGTGVTNTLANTLSRYFLVGLTLNLQKWSGTPQRGGVEMRRKGDGSFIY